MTRPCSACVPCAKFRRRTLAPASSSAPIMASEAVAGPMVVTMRLRAIGQPFFLKSASSFARRGRGGGAGAEVIAEVALHLVRDALGHRLTAVVVQAGRIEVAVPATM